MEMMKLVCNCDFKKTIGSEQTIYSQRMRQESMISRLLGCLIPTILALTG
jgi:hypothetical protein